MQSWWASFSCVIHAIHVLYLSSETYLRFNPWVSEDLTSLPALENYQDFHHWGCSTSTSKTSKRNSLHQQDLPLFQLGICCSTARQLGQSAPGANHASDAAACTLTLPHSGRPGLGPCKGEPPTMSLPNSAPGVPNMMDTGERALPQSSW